MLVISSDLFIIKFLIMSVLDQTLTRKHGKLEISVSPLLSRMWIRSNVLTREYNFCTNSGNSKNVSWLLNWKILKIKSDA